MFACVMINTKRMTRIATVATTNKCYMIFNKGFILKTRDKKS